MQNSSRSTVLQTLIALGALGVAGVLAWGWQELSLYTGFVTGPRKQFCPAGCTGWRHFGHALGVNLWHEIAIVAVALGTWWSHRIVQRTDRHFESSRSAAQEKA